MRFKKGELVVYAVAYCLEDSFYVDMTYMITNVGPFINGNGMLVDYEIQNNETWASAYDWQLRKFNPDPEPYSLIRHTSTAKFFLPEIKP